MFTDHEQDEDGKETTIDDGNVNLIVLTVIGCISLTAIVLTCIYICKYGKCRPCCQTLYCR